MCIIVNERGICSQHSSSHGLRGEAPVLLRSYYTTFQGFVLLFFHKCFVFLFFLQENENTVCKTDLILQISSLSKAPVM